MGGISFPAASTSAGWLAAARACCVGLPAARSNSRRSGQCGSGPQRDSKVPHVAVVVHHRLRSHGLALTGRLMPRSVKPGSCQTHAFRLAVHEEVALARSPSSAGYLMLDARQEVVVAYRRPCRCSESTAQIVSAPMDLIASGEAAAAMQMAQGSAHRGVWGPGGWPGSSISPLLGASELRVHHLVLAASRSCSTSRCSMSR